MRALLIVLVLCITGVIHAQFNQVDHGFLLDGVPAGTSSGISWYDFDGDGWDDLTVGQGNREILVYRNIQGTLQLFYAFANTTQVKSFQWVDFDNDNDADFFICAANASCKLLRNDGNMVFTDVSASLGMPLLDEDSVGASWGDYDRDGWVDVYVCNYYAQNWLLHNLGNGSFENVAIALGVSNSNGATYMCSWVDYNGDCLLDLFVANDLNQPSEMYENTGDGFQAVGSSIGLAISIEAMGVSWSDYDHDLDLDVYVTNAASGNKLLRNDGGVFTDVAAASGAAVNALSWGCMWLDFNHDTREDLHVATQAPLVAQNVNFLLEQSADTTFLNVSMPGDIGNSYASAKGDLNNDGFWDFSDAFVLPASFKVWQNQGVGGNWIKLHLQGTGGNTDAIGAKIFYWHGGNAHYTHTFSGESFFGQDSQYEILSLGASTMVDSLRIVWPGGRFEQFVNLEVNRLHTFTEANTTPLTLGASKPFLCAVGDELELIAPLADAYEWSTGAQSSSVVIGEPGAYYVHVTTGCSVRDSLSITIDFLTPPTIQEIAQLPTCFGVNDGCVNVLIDNIAPVEVVWDNGEPIDNPCSLFAGLYSYAATDEFQCVYTGIVELEEPTVVSVSAQTFALCAGFVAPAQLMAQGGTGSYTYSLADGSAIDALTPGEYVGVATDANGCQGSANFTIDAWPEVNFNASVDSVCDGFLASLQYFGSGGALPYAFDWQGQNPNALPTGNYVFVLTDGNGCSDEVEIEVAYYPFLDAQISVFTNANNGANGSMELSILGGEPPYDIQWSNGDTDDVLEGIGQGTYSATITDANDCVSTDSQSIIDLAVVELHNALVVYPNPFSNVISIETTGATSYVVRDLQGRCIASGKLMSSMGTVDTSAWPAGVFTLRVQLAGSVLTKCIIKI